jgi:hypothetical protein
MNVYVVLLALLFSANIASACKCAPPPSVSQSFQSATAVFIGKVETVEEVKFQRVITLRVIEAFKGVGDKTLVLHTGSGGGDCGYPFVIGQSYLVYASGTSDDLGTNICTRTKGVGEASPELATLRKLRGPVDE